jgi:hypothetical protein
MVPTLSGRIQTRLLLLLVLGLPYTALVTLVAPGAPGAGLDGLYAATFSVLAMVIVIGCLVFEPLYHLLMQFRWEKDWPIMVILLEGIPEGIVYYLILRYGLNGYHAADWSTFLVAFAPLWFLVWLAAIGPMRVPFHRWRFRGGQLL